MCWLPRCSSSLLVSPWFFLRKSARPGVYLPRCLVWVVDHALFHRSQSVFVLPLGLTIRCCDSSFSDPRLLSGWLLQTCRECIRSCCLCLHSRLGSWLWLSWARWFFASSRQVLFSAFQFVITLLACRQGSCCAEPVLHRSKERSFGSLCATGARL